MNLFYHKVLQIFMNSNTPLLRKKKQPVSRLPFEMNARSGASHGDYSEIIFPANSTDSRASLV